jgi:hypothetical protein
VIQDLFSEMIPITDTKLLALLIKELVLSGKLTEMEAHL